MAAGNCNGSVGAAEQEALQTEFQTSPATFTTTQQHHTVGIFLLPCFFFPRLTLVVLTQFCHPVRDGALCLLVGMC